MILADKIINERKKNGWSQEELAEKVSVSRQSVSKWEGAQAVPDLNRILQMAELFKVSTDYLLKDEMQPEILTLQGVAQTVTASETEPPVRRISLEEADNFINTIKKNTPSAIIATCLLILEPVVLIFLAGLADDGRFGISENLACGIGLVVLFLCIIAGVCTWIIVDSKEKPFKFLENEDFDTEYGVSGMVKEKKKSFESIYTMLSVLGVASFICSPIPIIITALMETADYIIVAMVCVLLILVAVGVALLMYANRIWGCFNVLLNEEKITPKQRKDKRNLSRIGGIYWCIVVAAFLAVELITNRWEFAGVVLPVAGILYVAVVAIAKMIMNAED